MIILKKEQSEKKQSGNYNSDGEPSGKVQF